MIDRERRAILITRPEHDAAATADLVAARGFDPVIAPVIAVRPRRIAPRGRFDAVLVTSRNAIEALPERLRATPLLAVGSATAERARAAGFAAVRDAAGDAAALLALARDSLPAGARLLFAHGLGQGDALAGSLAEAGFVVTRRCAYAAGPVRRLPESARAALGAGQVRAAMFLSAETARAFVRLLPRRLHEGLADVDAVVIGDAAGQALALLPWRRVRVSVKPTLDEVLALL